MKTLLPLLVTCLLPIAALADSAAPAKRFLETRHAQVVKILKQPANGADALAKRNGELKKALADLLDFEELSKRALQDHWETLSTDKRKKFSELLAQLVERSYQKNLESTMDFRVTYDEAKQVGDSIQVSTEARSTKNRRSPPIAIDYTLATDGQAFRVYDITTDGVSLVSNYRRQFNKIIRREGWDALLDRMKSKLAADSESF